MVRRICQAKKRPHPEPQKNYLPQLPHCTWRCPWPLQLPQRLLVLPWPEQAPHCRRPLPSQEEQERLPSPPQEEQDLLLLWCLPWWELP